MFYPILLRTTADNNVSITNCLHLKKDKLPFQCFLIQSLFIFTKPSKRWCFFHGKEKTPEKPPGLEREAGFDITDFKGENNGKTTFYKFQVNFLNVSLPCIRQND